MKVDNLYLTGINEIGQDKSKNNGKKTNTKVSNFLVKNTKKFEKTTSDFLDYMLNDHFHLADMSKLEDYFRAKGIESFKKFNNQSDEIKKKKKILSELDQQIEKEITSKLIFDTTNIEEAFQSEIENYKKLIEQKEHDLLTYTKENERAIHENNLLKGQFKEKLKYSKIFGKQHEKYSYIKNNIETQLNIHQNLYNDMKNFDSTTRSYYVKELKNKKIVFTRTEYDVLEAKNEILKTKTALDEIKGQISVKMELVAKRRKGNEKYFMEYRNHLKDYFKDFVRLDRVCKELKEDNLETLILKFKQAQIQYNGSNLMFSQINKEIHKLNEIYAKLQFNLDKKTLSGRVQAEISSETYNAQNKQHGSIQEIESLYNFILQNNKATSKIIFDKRTLLYNLLIFCTKYEHIISQIINSSYFHELKLDNISHSKREYILINSNSIEIDSLNVFALDDWEISQCNILNNNLDKLFINFFTQFIRKIYHIQSIYFIDIIQSFNPDFPSSNKIIDVKNQDTSNLLTNLITEYANDKDKMKILRSTVKKEIKLKTDNIDRKMKDITISSKTTVEDLFSNYYQQLYFKNINLDNNSDTVMADMFSSLKSKFFNQINKFTNDTVETFDKTKSTEQISLQGENPKLLLKESSLIAGSYKKTFQKNDTIGRNLQKVIKTGESVSIKEYSIKGQMLDKNISESNSNRDTKTPEKSRPQSLNDSYHSEKIVSVEEKKQTKKYNFFGYNKNKEESLTTVYRRIVDLNTLENKVFKKNNKRHDKIDNTNFSELLFNLKKKIKKSQVPITLTRKSTVPRTSFINKRNSTEANLLPNGLNSRGYKLNYNANLISDKSRMKSSSVSKSRAELFKSKNEVYNLEDNERLIMTTTNWNSNYNETNESCKNKKNFPTFFNQSNGFSYTNYYTNQTSDSKKNKFKYEN